MSNTSNLSLLEAARQQAELSSCELWFRYFTLGGSASQAEVEGHIRDGGVLDDGQHDVLVHALNERFVEMDLGYPLPYSDDPLI